MCDGCVVDYSAAMFLEKKNENIIINYKSFFFVKSHMCARKLVFLLKYEMCWLVYSALFCFHILTGCLLAAVLL